jgi:ADP-ribosylglycohydrolase
MEGYRSRVRGCLLGGAVGDALGWPVEFLSLAEMDGLVGPGSASIGEITDDTQMTLFTAEGLIRASVRWDRGVCHPPSVVHRAYLRWLDTQTLPAPPPAPDGWLAAQAWLYARRAPGNACLSGLSAGGMGTPSAPANPSSKGCGAVMRSAPFGLVPRTSAREAFDLAVECAVQTHGHPSGYLAAGAFAAIVRGLLDGVTLDRAVVGALDLLPGDDEVTAALRAALAAVPLGGPSDVEHLGAGWVAEEALAIGVACALTHPGDLRAALLLAVTHSGDSDSTGSICGNLVGALGGEEAVPPDWAASVEGRDTILALADDFAAEFTTAGWRAGRWGDRYPGS